LERRGIERGEFRPVDIDHAAFCIIEPTTMMPWRESFEQYENHAPDADAFRRVHLDLLLRGRVPAGRAADANAADAFQHVQALLYATVQQQAAMLSFVDSFWVMAVLFTALCRWCFYAEARLWSGTSAGPLSLPFGAVAGVTIETLQPNS
jgi:hypothetical protein